MIETTSPLLGNLLVGLIVWPMLTGVVLLFFRDHVRVQRLISGLSVAVGLGFSVYLAAVVRGKGMLVLDVGGYPAPYGIVLVADLFSAAMLVMTMLVAAAVLFTAFVSMDADRERFYFYPFFQFLLMGINGAFLTGDLFNLFVWFEVLLIASYILIALGGEARQLREGFKYVIINVLASALFLVGVAGLYSSLGTVNMADIAYKAAQAESPGLLIALGILFFIVFGIKAAIFPLYFWLPRTYFAPPTTIIAFFGGIMTKVGVYAIVRVFTLFLPEIPSFVTTLLVWTAGITMVIGILGTIAQMDIKRILSWHIISQIGYMIMGLAVFTPLALGGTIYYIVHVAVVKSCLFLIGGAVEDIAGTSHLKRVSGLLLTHPALAALFFVGGLSLAGVPPSSGFFGKLALAQAGLAAGRYGLVATAILVGLFTLYSMIKIYRMAFWGDGSRRGGGDQKRDQKRPAGMAVSAIVSLLAASVAMGIFAQFALGFAVDAAEQLLNPSMYIHAVLGYF